jgi:hypothetical protein
MTNQDSQRMLELLTREGVLLSVRVSFYRAAKKLQASDLGLDADDVTDRLISLGHKRLLPKEVLAPLALIESRVHSLVDANTFPFLGGLARFIPNKMLTEVTSKLHELEAEFNREKNRFTMRYSTLREQALGEWREQARKLSSRPELIVASVSAAFPQPDKLARHFGFGISMFQIRAPEALDMTFIQESEQRGIIETRAKAAQEARQRISEGVEGFVGDCVTSLREQTAKLCSEMQEAFKDGKTGVHQRTLNRLTEFITNFRQLNFAGDEELDRRLEHVRATYLTTTAEEYRDNATARRRMQDGIRSLGEAARELATAGAKETVESFGRMGARRFTMAA